MRMKQQQILNFEMVQISGSEKLYLNDKSLLKCDLNTMGDITHISGRKSSLIISSLTDFFLNQWQKALDQNFTLTSKFND